MKRKSDKKRRSCYFVANPAVFRSLKPVELITDRAKRYRANSPGSRPPGPKVCAFCGSKKNVEVGHLDGNESHGEPENLDWTCRSCNTKLGAAFKRLGLGVRTRQFNPRARSARSGIAKNAEGGRHVPTFTQYLWAVSNHSRGAHDEGGAVIHATPKHKRREYAARIAEFKGQRRRASFDEIPF